MKKQNKFLSLNISELNTKRDLLLKEFVAFKLSLDPTKITESSNVDALRKDIKMLQRQIAIVSSQNGGK